MGCTVGPKIIMCVIWNELVISILGVGHVILLARRART